jgi:DNA-directed RNA polymerase specialized sigma24 family protein
MTPDQQDVSDSRSHQPSLSPTDEELWSAFASGSDAALDALIERYRAPLYWYLLLSTGKQDAAARHSRDAWALLAAYRQPFEGFASFKSWLYGVATQSAVPATHSEAFGFGDLLDDLKRAPQTSRRGQIFFAIADMARAERQPFLLATLVGLPVPDVAKACNFTVERTWRCLEKAYARLARSDPFERAGVSDGL